MKASIFVLTSSLLVAPNVDAWSKVDELEHQIEMIKLEDPDYAEAAYKTRQWIKALNESPEVKEANKRRYLVGEAYVRLLKMRGARQEFGSWMVNKCQYAHQPSLSTHTLADLNQIEQCMIKKYGAYMPGTPGNEYNFN
jgi:hypothetical protein